MTEPHGVAPEQVKRIRTLKKKLGQIENLKEKDPSTLDQQARVKIASESEIRAEIEALESPEPEQTAAVAAIDSPVNVLFYLGLGGRTRQLQVCKDASLHGVTRELLELITPDPSLCLKITAGGEVITSVHQLLVFHCRDIQIFATLQKDVWKMPLAEVTDELTMTDAEFKGHRFALSKLPHASTPREVATFLRNNNLLLTSAQAASLFDLLVTKLQVIESMRFGLRGQLILALHTFCLEPYAIWEPDDGNSECLWANMDWSSMKLEPDSRYKIRGRLVNFPDNTSASASARQKDVAGLRAILSARRQGSGDELERMIRLEAYQTPILPR